MKYLLFRFTINVLIVFSLVGCMNSSVASDREMVEKFQKHRDKFIRLIEMLKDIELSYSYGVRKSPEALEIAINAET